MAQQFQPIPLVQCVFGNQGIQSVIYHLRQMPDFNQLPEPVLRAAAIGLLTAGASSDDDHDFPYQRFHRLYHDLNRAGQPKWRDGLRDVFWQMVMDMATILDRASGGATCVIHCPGTRPPGTAATPQEVKMEAFLPRPLIVERPEVGIALSRIAQHFAEHVGVPAMERWDRASNSSAWQAGHTPRRTSVYRGGNQPIIPRSASPRYVLYGRIPGELEQRIAQEAPALLINVPPPIVTPVATGGTAAAPLVATQPRGDDTAPVLPPAPSSRTSVQPPSRRDRPVTPDASLVDPERQTLSPEGREHIRLAYSASDPYTSDKLLEMVAAHYDDEGNIVPDTPRKNRGKSRARDADMLADDVADVLAALQCRIDELEHIKASQELEIVGLRSALRGLVAGSTEHAPPAVGVDAGPSRSATADTFGGRRAGTRPASRAESTSSFSAISSVSSLSTSSNPTTPTRWGRSPGQEGAATRPPPPSLATMSPLPAPFATSRPSGFVFGPHSQRVLEANDIPPATHNVLQDVADLFVEDEWVTRLRQRIFTCSTELAKLLVNAMKKDRASVDAAEY
ncbi:hypothetical protein C8T65DRAFT_748367 [Cerioporus squamosus]|nr:hypothetical protein C8T65DRAFT_748367 [Cerioporus squamosus]